jgi:hypothetical protein
MIKSEGLNGLDVQQLWEEEECIEDFGAEDRKKETK